MSSLYLDMILGKYSKGGHFLFYETECALIKEMSLDI